LEIRSENEDEIQENPIEEFYDGADLFSNFEQDIQSQNISENQSLVTHLDSQMVDQRNGISEIDILSISSMESMSQNIQNLLDPKTILSCFLKECCKFKCGFKVTMEQVQNSRKEYLKLANHQIKSKFLRKKMKEFQILKKTQKKNIQTFQFLSEKWTESNTSFYSN